VERLGLTMRGVDEVRVGRPEIVSKFVERFGADEYAGRRVQHAVFGIEVLDRCSAARRITLAEDLLKITLEQFADVVGHQRHAA
jgi:hypothetical protein